jgi:hypothetical protein
MKTRIGSIDYTYEIHLFSHQFCETETPNFFIEKAAGSVNLFVLFARIA